MAEWDTRAIHSRIIEKARVPRGGRYQTISNLLPLVDQRLRTSVVSRLLAVAEDWLTATTSFSVLSGQASYRLPWRNLRVLDVALLNASGDPVRDFSRATAEQEKTFRASALLKQTGQPVVWLIEASSLRLHPVPDASGAYTLAVRYARRPGRLVDSTAAAPNGPATVAAISGAPGDLSVQISPAGAFGTTGTVTVDVLRGTPGFESLKDDVVATVTTGGVFLSFVGYTAATLPLSVGDYISLAGTSPVPQVPLDWIAVLEEAVVEQLLRDAGDAQGAQAAKEAKDEMALAGEALVESRTSEPQVIVNDDWL